MKRVFSKMCLQRGRKGRERGEDRGAGGGERWKK